MRGMLRFVLLFLSLICSAREPEKLELGIYINRIDAFDIKTGTAEVDFWLWGRRIGNNKPILSTLEISNGRILQTGELVKKQQGKLYYETKRYSATVICRVDLQKFPFDKQTLQICIEDSEALADQMIFSADIKNSKIDPSWRMNEWNTSKLHCFSNEHIYPTSFGDPDVKESSESSRYSRLNIEIDLIRNGDFISKCIKYFWAITVSVIVGLFSLWIRVTDLDARFGMTIGSLFANVGCSFIIADKLPDSPELTIAEIISYASLSVIMILLLESIISLCLYNRNKIIFSQRLDHGVFWGVSLIYSIFIICISTGIR